ncbi:hypothetical protein PHMEG_00035071, partial [Phytophthora megakarya]
MGAAPLPTTAAPTTSTGGQQPDGAAPPTSTTTSATVPGTPSDHNLNTSSVATSQHQIVPVGGQGDLVPQTYENQIQPYEYPYRGRHAGSQQAPTPRTPRTAIASYGGYTMADFAGTPGFGFDNPFSRSANVSSPVASEGGQERFEFGMSPCVKNAVRMIQPFYSEGAIVEKTLSFWDAFERATVCLNDAVRLNDFRVLLKGKSGEDWWMHSRIEDFDTLRTRFYNQFICQTPLQMIERLRNAKRSKGMSAEVWGDVISNLCDSAQVTDPQMRYQYFLAGIRNKEWKAALQTTMIIDIPRAVMTLLYKNMHLPTENELEFAGETTKKPSSEESMMQQMMGQMQKTQHLLVSQNQLLARPPRSPKN